MQPQFCIFRNSMMSWRKSVFQLMPYRKRVGIGCSLNLDQKRSTSKLLGTNVREAYVVKPPNTGTRTHRNQFTEMFRSMSPYIAVHQGTIIVIHICGTVIESPLIGTLMQDIALLNTLGIKLVLVAGSRPQINSRLCAHNLNLHLDDAQMRITDFRELECAKDAAGYVRVELESYLARGLINAPGIRSRINATSGNFVTAQPVGVRGGIDFKFTGDVRRINTEKVRSVLDQGDIVIMSNLGYSASGDVFNCLSEEVASKCAVELAASKLIYIHGGEEIIDKASGQSIHTLQLSEAEELIELLKDNPHVDNSFLFYLTQAVKACAEGVRRVHLVSQHKEGTLLEELFTRDGDGIMISRDIYEGIRTATTADIPGIMRLIQPLLDQDILVTRSQEQIELNVDKFAIVERDGAIIACATLEVYDNGFAEMACVAVDSAYRNSGKGNALLGYILRKASSLGVSTVFVLTTRTAHWFVERGFRSASINDLPESKRRSIDLSRKSKVYTFDVSKRRAIDEQELLMQL